MPRPKRKNIKKEGFTSLNNEGESSDKAKKREKAKKRRKTTEVQNRKAAIASLNDISQPEEAPVETGTEQRTNSEYPLQTTETKTSSKLTSEKAREMRQLRNVYARKKLPPLQCNTCQFASRCPQYRAEYECAYTAILHHAHLEDTDQLKEVQQHIVEACVQRTELALVIERLNGGEIDKDVSMFLRDTFEMVSKMRDQNLEELESAKPEKEKPSMVLNILQSLGISDKPTTEITVVEDEPEREPPPVIEDKDVAKQVVIDKQEMINADLGRILGVPPDSFKQ